jgi:hypothetical protein
MKQTSQHYDGALRRNLLRARHCLAWRPDPPGGGALRALIVPKE